MNTHDIDIELPPLPEPGEAMSKWAYNESDMQAYARAAIEADRQRGGEMAGWQPIETAPKDNKRQLYLARLDDQGKLVELDFDGIWEYWQESWELSHINGYNWMSDGGIEEPTHWAYQDEPLPVTPQPAEPSRGEPVYLYRRKGQDAFVTCDKARYSELSDKPNLFEMRVLYTAPQPAEPEKVPSDTDMSKSDQKIDTSSEHVDSVDMGQPAASAEPVLRIYAEGSMRVVTEWMDGALDLPDGDHDLYAAPVAAQPSEQAQQDSIDAAFEAVRKRFCLLPRYSFFSDSSGAVRRVNDASGNWIEFAAAHALFDPVAVDAARQGQGDSNG